VRAEGGEPVPAGWHDGELDVDCRLERTEDGQTRCIPWVGGAPLAYSDPECTSPVVLPSACERPRFVLERIVEGTTCRPSSDSYRVLELQEGEISLDAPYVMTEGACVPAGESIDRAWRAVPMDPSRFVAVTSVRGEDTGTPIVLDRMVGEDGSTGRGALRDRSRDAVCSLAFGLEVSPQPCQPSLSLPLTRVGGASCDERWAAIRDGCEPMSYAYNVDRGACRTESNAHVYALESMVSEDERAAAGWRCAGWASGYTFFHTRLADDEVPWASKSWSGSGRLRVETWSDESGHELFRSWSHYRDTELDAECFAVNTTEGLRCVPGLEITATGGAAPRLGAYFADDACTAPAAMPSSADCVPPFATSRTDGCESLIDGVYRVGGELDHVYQRDASGACVIADTEGAPAAHAVTAIPLDTLAPLERSVE
jgi:hypothetical protein